MKKSEANQVAKLLGAVQQLTAERERDALLTALLKSLLEVLPASAVEYRADTSGTPPRRLARPGAAPAAARRVVYPVHDDQGRAGSVTLELPPGAVLRRPVVQALLSIYRNFCTVIDDAQRDTLTGLLNRKTFERSIQGVLAESRSVAEARAAGAPEQRRAPAADAGHWLAVIDIDHFKRINDGFGHLYGDEVLILLAQLMRRSFRSADRLYRFGGEEFAVLLAPCSEADVRRVLERFRAAVREHEFPQVGQVTVSIGFVAVALQDIPTTVVAHADEALYASKRGGRDRVTGYADLGAPPAPAQQSSVDLF